MWDRNSIGGGGKQGNHDPPDGQPLPIPLRKRGLNTTEKRFTDGFPECKQYGVKPTKWRYELKRPTRKPKEVEKKTLCRDAGVH